MAVRLAQHDRFTVERFQQLAADGYIAPNARLERIDGKIIEKSPIGSRHNAAVNRLARIFFEGVNGRTGIVQVRGAIRLTDILSPQPDLAVLRPRQDAYEAALPEPKDLLLIVEVAETLPHLALATNALRYAAAGIVEYVVFDLVRHQIVVHRRPHGNGYQQVRTLPRAGNWTPLFLPHLLIFGKDIFG